MENELSIIIPTKDRNEILMKSLEKLQNVIKGKHIEVIVVNDSKNNLPELENLFEFNILAIKNKGSGVASARNTGASNARSPVLLFLDDDMWFTKSALDSILTFHSKKERSVLNINWVYPDNLIEKLQKLHLGVF